MQGVTSETTLNHVGLAALIGRILMYASADCGNITFERRNDGSITVRSELISQSDLDEILLGV